MTCQEVRPDATNGLKLTMVNIIFIPQRPELLLLLMCTATKKKENFRKVVWEHNTVQSQRSKLSYFSSFCQ